MYELGPRIEPLGWEVPQTPLLMGTTKLYVPYPEVEALADRRVVVLDDRSDDPMLLEVEGEAVPFTVGTVPEFLEVTLQSATTRDLDGASAHMLGNVVPATHGETVADEVIGDGDSSVALQEFTLAKSPVTHTSDPTAVGGARNSTEVIVDRVRWAERTGLFGAGASDRIYTTWIDDEQKMHVRFGDGRFGARLPTGRANIVATYRQGLGGGATCRRVGSSPLSTSRQGSPRSAIRSRRPGALTPNRWMERERTLPTRCEPSIGQCRYGTSPTWHVSSPVSRKRLPPGFGTERSGWSMSRSVARMAPPSPPTN